MVAAFIEHRPHAISKQVPISHYVIIVNGKEVHGYFSTLKKATNEAYEYGYRPVHVAKERHLQNRSKPEHWRVEPSL